VAIRNCKYIQRAKQIDEINLISPILGLIGAFFFLEMDGVDASPMGEASFPPTEDSLILA